MSKKTSGRLVNKLPQLTKPPGGYHGSEVVVIIDSPPLNATIFMICKSQELF
jgi:hypothetical protein